MSGPGPAADAGRGGPVAVAVVGTGRMGSAMATRLASAGHPLSLWNRTNERARTLASRLPDARVAPTPADAVRNADVVVVSLADDAAVRAAYSGDAGLVAGLAPGAVVADTSTVDPETLRELAPAVHACGAALVDVPVSGSVSTVEAGQLLVMAGGDEVALDRVCPVLATFARRVLHLGPLGSGATMKLVVNDVVHALDVAVAEALVLAERAGIDRHLAYEVFASSAVAAPFVLYKRQAFEDPEHAPVAFALDLVAKDLDLALALAERVGAEVPQLRANRAVVEQARDLGLGGADLSAVAELYRRA
jgi:3-hydroxyisobutyrate dehydrogenase/2-hydroxy-3-oxopropionate reductase